MAKTLISDPIWGPYHPRKWQNFDAILAPLAKLWIHKIFFVDFKLDFVEIVTIYQPNLRKWQKKLVSGPILSITT